MDSLDVFALQTIISYTDVVSASYLAQTCHYLRKKVKESDIWYTLWSRARLKVSEYKHSFAYQHGYCWMVSSEQMHEYIAYSAQVISKFLTMMVASAEKQKKPVPTVNEEDAETGAYYTKQSLRIGLYSKEVPDGVALLRVISNKGNTVCEEHKKLYCTCKEHWLPYRYDWPKKRKNVDYHTLCMIDGNRYIFKKLNNTACKNRIEKLRERVVITEYSLNKKRKELEELERDIKKSRKYLDTSVALRTANNKKAGEPRPTCRLKLVYRNALKNYNEW
jgi:hypothetical protein